ncbi:MAG: hypothetical protein HFJ10_01040 [Lachnospiraceae bacterium]|nr:hypothetical protein [Lachnospiraceae bacterium]
MSNKLFRTNMFGGYKKEDVLSYIAKLEAELTRSQELLAQKDNIPEASKVTRPKEAEAVQSVYEDVIVLSDTQEEAQADREFYEDSQGVGADKASSGACEEQNKELEEALRELELVKQELEDKKAELEASSRLCDQSRARLNLALTEKEMLENEAEKLREEQKRYEQDYDAVKEVLLNARIDAEIILTKAKKEAKLLLENTQRQISEQKKETVGELMRQLVENYNGLQTSKYHLERQVKSIERTTQQIEVIQSKMEDFLGEDINIMN